MLKFTKNLFGITFWLYVCSIKITKTKTNKMANLNLTPKETEFLNEMRKSDFYENGIDSILWDYSVNENLSFSGKTRSGVVSSLTQKNII